VGKLLQVALLVGVEMFCATGAASAAPLPNPKLTPGVTRALSLETVCSTKWGRDRRFVTEAMKKQVAAWYHVPWSRRARYEFDHLIPRELAGDDNVGNLWPQLKTGPHNALEKDRLENFLHRAVCLGTISLEDAQAAVRTDWPAAAKRYLPARPAKRLTRSEHAR
jgi:hypothetical protein